jgi:exopolysaccharide production protein ExoQ
MKILHFFEKIYVVVVLIFLSGAGVAGRVGAGGTPPPPQPWEVIGRLIVCATLAPLLLLHFRKIISGVRHSGWLIGLSVFAVISCGWAQDPRFVFRHGVFLCVVTAFGIYVATCFEWDEQLDMFGWMTVLVVVGSALVAIYIPSYGLSTDLHVGAVKGMYPQKNNLGAMLSFGILTFLFAKPKGVPVWVRIPTLVGACILLILSSSATAIVGLAGCLAIYPLWQLYRASKRNAFLLWISAVPVIGLGAVIAATNLEFFTKLAGRSATLSDRIPLWQGVVEAIGRKPFLGYGYDIFWTVYSQDLYKIEWVMRNWRPPHAHNGYLDVLLSMGIVGLAVFMVGFVINVWRASRLARIDSIYAAKWPLFILLFFAIVNLGESYILRLMSFFWIPYVVIYVSSALLLAQAETEEVTEQPAEALDTDDPGHVDGIVPGYST